MACFDELVDDIDKDLLNEIQKNEEIMKGEFCQTFLSFEAVELTTY